MATDNTFLAAATAAATSNELILSSGAVAHVSVSGLSSGESVQIETYQGSAFVPLQAGGPIVLTRENMALVLCGPGQFRFRKPVTAAVVGVYVDQ